MSGSLRRFSLHLSCCIAFLSLPFIFSPDFNYSSSLFRIQPFQRDLIAYILLLAYFYLNYILFIPAYYSTRRYVPFAVITILCYAVVTFLPSAIIPHHFSPGGPDFHGIGGSNLFPIGPAHRDNTLSHLLREHFFQFLMAFVFSLLLKTFHLLKETEKKKVSSELSLLKAQINPHFLFNTLNSIYSTAIDEKAVKTQKAILNLSGMMRYITTETDTEYISLEKELHYINSYIDLQKLKLADTIELDYILQGTMERKKIAPLILITFIENAFKHGVSSNNKSPINIHLRFTEKYLTLNVQNKKSEKFQEYITKTRIGLDNTISRLKLLYPHNHQLEITDDTENYQVKLTMELL